MGLPLSLKFYKIIGQMCNSFAEAMKYANKADLNSRDASLDTLEKHIVASPVGATAIERHFSYSFLCTPATPNSGSVPLSFISQPQHFSTDLVWKTLHRNFGYTSHSFAYEKTTLSKCFKLQDVLP